MKKNLTTDVEKTWCKGCGNFGILNALEKTVEKLSDHGIEKKNIVMTAGIGCHGKIFDYVALSGLYSLHGRSKATAQGMKLGNPSLKVIDFAGDGDAFGEGIAHLLFAAKRNADITVIIHDNGVYALTTGQSSPTSEKGHKGPSTPEGNIEEPLNPINLLLMAGASFVARGYAGKIDHLADLMVEAVLHEGFSVVIVKQPSVVFSNNYKLYNEIVEVISKPAKTVADAMELAKVTEEKMAIGVFYKMQKPVFHKKLYGDWNPISDKMEKSKRIELIQEFL